MVGVLFRLWGEDDSLVSFFLCSLQRRVMYANFDGCALRVLSGFCVLLNFTYRTACERGRRLLQFTSLVAFYYSCKKYT